MEVWICRQQSTNLKLEWRTCGRDGGSRYFLDSLLPTAIGQLAFDGPVSLPCKQMCVEAHHDSSPPSHCHRISYTLSSDKQPGGVKPPVQPHTCVFLVFSPLCRIWDGKEAVNHLASSRCCITEHSKDCISLSLPLNYASVLSSS